MNDQVRRWYREGRRRGLSASAAIEYGRNRKVIADSPLDFCGEPDDESGLLVVLFDPETERIVDVLGAVDVAFSVSDHGNVHYDEHDPFLVLVVADLIREAAEASPEPLGVQ